MTRKLWRLFCFWVLIAGITACQTDDLSVPTRAMAAVLPTNTPQGIPPTYTPVPETAVFTPTPITTRPTS
ncbi:MAG: hypothetical protein D6706_12985, partial [Chloroflexi bacterium]